MNTTSMDGDDDTMAPVGGADDASRANTAPLVVVPSYTTTPSAELFKLNAVKVRVTELPIAAVITTEHDELVMYTPAGAALSSDTADGTSTLFATSQPYCTYVSAKDTPANSAPLEGNVVDAATLMLSVRALPEDMYAVGRAYCRSDASGVPFAVPSMTVTFSWLVSAMKVVTDSVTRVGAVNTTVHVNGVAAVPKPDTSTLTYGVSDRSTEVSGQLVLCRTSVEDVSVLENGSHVPMYAVNGCVPVPLHRDQNDNVNAGTWAQRLANGTIRAGAVTLPAAHLYCSVIV